MLSLPVIEICEFSKSFYTDEIETTALSNLDLTIHRGEYVAISGPSGCGKSTLLSLLGLLDTANTGQYTLDGIDTSDLKDNERAAIRNKHIGFVFQAFNLINNLTIRQNVALPLTYRDDVSNEQRNEMVESALAKVDMLHRANHFPSQLSGGQQQRVAIARAVAGNPSIVLADEPTGNLDSDNAGLVLSLLKELHEEGATICMVTHDPRSERCAERVIKLKDGVIHSDRPILATSKVA